MGGCGSCSNPNCNCADGSCTCVSDNLDGFLGDHLAYNTL